MQYIEAGIMHCLNPELEILDYRQNVPDTSSALQCVEKSKHSIEIFSPSQITQGI